jgi:hypothetical protein
MILVPRLSFNRPAKESSFGFGACSGFSLSNDAWDLPSCPRRYVLWSTKRVSKGRNIAMDDSHAAGMTSVMHERVIRLALVCAAVCRNWDSE